MPKYDAFGREIGEDTLAGLGADPSARPRPIDPEPAEPASFSIPGQIPAAGRPRRTRRGVRGFGCLFALVFAAVLLAGPVVALSPHSAPPGHDWQPIAATWRDALLAAVSG